MTALRKLGSKSYRLLRSYSKPSHLAVLARQAAGRHHPVGSDSAHLAATMAWLCRSQDVVGGDGSSSGYFFEKGWEPPYPETTGYIIPTFLRYAAARGDTGFVDRAVTLGDWEIGIQLPSGAVRGGRGLNDYPIVFNTGQVLLGWCALFRATQEDRFLAAATRAADWLLDVQDDDGKWLQHCFMDVPHAYHSRVAWALGETFRLTGEERYLDAAAGNTRWALSGQRADGWLEHMGFTPDEPPLSHTIAYTMRGLLETAAFLPEGLGDEARRLAVAAARRMLRVYELHKTTPEGMPAYMPASFAPGWRPASSASSCLAGNAQLAILWLKVYDQSDDPRFLNAALKMLDQVKQTQDLRAANPGIRGGVAGSHPVWGAYLRLAYPNWAAKFFADALMLQEALMRRLEGADTGSAAT